MAYSPCNPKLGPLSSANSPGALEMLPHFAIVSNMGTRSSSSSARRETSSAKSRSMTELQAKCHPKNSAINKLFYFKPDHKKTL